MKIEYMTKDQNWQDETTIYWFRLDGIDAGTGVTFENDTYGVAETADDTYIVDADGTPITYGDYDEIAVRKHCIVTNEMRMTDGEISANATYQAFKAIGKAG